MKVILKQDVKNLGKKETVCEVNDGYARNFLIPKGLAVEANNSNINVLNIKKGAEQLKKERELKEAKELASRVDKITLVIKAKSGESSKLFGSITSKDIADKLKADFNIDIDKKKIDLPESLKTLGSFGVEIKVYAGVIAKLNVKVEQV